MKAAAQFAVSLAALTGLLGGFAAHATDIAELPLKASVLAKPNVIWGLDDSGSMDSELMLATNDGAFWWDHTNGKGWDSSGKLVYNDVGDASSQYRKMVYLFPNEVALGSRVYNDADNDHFAVMPTAQFAWLRSPKHNPIYYNTTITYAPWSPAYISGSLKPSATYKASTTAAKSHPIYGTATHDLTATVAQTSTLNRTFTAFKGMKIPKGAKYCNYVNGTTCSTTTTATADVTVGNTPQRVIMAYYPATFWNAETCTVNASETDDALRTCTTAPDGTTLKRYEIKSGNTFPSGRSYADEIQNFANWFEFYRKRKLMLNAAVGESLESLTGMRMQMVHFNTRQSVTSMYDLDSTDNAKNGRALAGLFYNTNGSGGTPTRETLKHIGDQFKNNSAVIQYACQRNNAFVLTDGFANASAVSMPSYDSGKSSADWGSGAPYETIYSGSLADIALRYYTNNLYPTLATGRLPAIDSDKNTDLHMNTYGMTLGAKGTIWTDASTPAPTDKAAWPNPSSNRSPTSVDDLWHATINGRGKMYTASNPTETATAIGAALLDMKSQTGAQGGIAVSTVNLMRGNGFAYMGSYNPSGWVGDLTANTIDAATATISSTETWSASKKLDKRDWTTRQIVTDSGSGGAVFSASSVGGTVNPGDAWGTTADVIDYLRGKRTLEGSVFRKRSSLLGAVISAEPVIDAENDVVYLASGEGMLHAFDIKTSSSTVGEELWAFVPYAVLPDLGQTSARTYVFKTQLDGTPTVGKTASGKLLVAGMGAAGNQYYALDVSSPRSNSEASTGWVKWRFPGAATSGYATKVGQTLGKPAIALTNDGYRVIVTSGYNSTADGKGRLFVLDPSDGSVKKEFVTPDGAVGAEAGLAQVAVFVDSATGKARYAYGGDLLGNLWRFDLDAASGSAPLRLAVFKDSGGTAQPVTAMPLLTEIGGNRVVLVGTGRLLAITDFGRSGVQSFYAIADKGSELGTARNSLVSLAYNPGTDVITQSSAVNWKTGNGWYMDLPAGEQQNTRPALAYGGVAFTTNTAGASDCTASSRLYVLNIETGKEIDSVGFASTVISTKANVSAVTAVATSDGTARGLMQDGEGNARTEKLGSGDPIKPAKNSWREVRQE